MVELLASELNARRERYNSLFALARRIRPRLDGEIFLENLRTFVGPIVQASGATSQEDARPLVESLYELCLELTGSDLFRRSAATTTLWTDLLPLAAPRLLSSPEALAAALTNAVYNLEAEESPDWQRWLEMMNSAQEICSDSEEWLRFGQAASWCCGMAHFRESAWELAAGLSRPLQSLLPADWESLKGDPWAPCRSTRDAAPKVLARVGAFVGFGGKFQQPPWVAYAGDERFVVQDGEAEWVLSCDAFGATMKSSVSSDILVPARDDVTVMDDGLVRWSEHRVRFEELAPVRSYAVSETVLAVTSDLSHSVFLFLGPGRRKA